MKRNLWTLNFRRFHIVHYYTRGFVWRTRLIKRGVIHKPCGQIFDPPPPLWTILLNKANVVTWIFGKLPLPPAMSTWFMNALRLSTLGTNVSTVSRRNIDFFWKSCHFNVSNERQKNEYKTTLFLTSPST